MAAIIALVLFVLAAFGVTFDRVSIVDLGLAFLALQLIIPLWPSGFFSRPAQH